MTKDCPDCQAHDKAMKDASCQQCGYRRLWHTVGQSVETKPVRIRGYATRFCPKCNWSETKYADGEVIIICDGEPFTVKKNDEDQAQTPLSACDGDVIGSLLPTNEQRIKSLLGMADMCAKETSVFNRFENSQENEHN